MVSALVIPPVTWAFQGNKNKVFALLCFFTVTQAILIMQPILSSGPGWKWNQFLLLISVGVWKYGVCLWQCMGHLTVQSYTYLVRSKSHRVQWGLLPGNCVGLQPKTISNYLYTVVDVCLEDKSLTQESILVYERLWRCIKLLSSRCTTVFNIKAGTLDFFSNSKECCDY